jgi:hypothetical protein
MCVQTLPFFDLSPTLSMPNPLTINIVNLLFYFRLFFISYYSCHTYRIRLCRENLFKNHIKDGYCTNNIILMFQLFFMELCPKKNVFYSYSDVVTIIRIIGFRFITTALQIAGFLMCNSWNLILYGV